MTIDLESSLEQLARSVHDDEVATRMNGQVHRMVAQIRRRRAARYTATGVVSVGAVAAVAVGALQLADPEAPAPVAPATEDSDGDLSYDVTGLEGRYVCGEVAPEPPEAPDDALVLEGRVAPAVAYGDPAPLELTLINIFSMSVASSSLVDVVVLSDGVVVGTSSVDPLALGLIPGTDPAGESAATIAACGSDTPLGGGEYQVVASITLGLADGTSRTVATEPMPFTIGANPLDAITEASGEAAGAQGLAAVAEIVASAGQRADPFGVCGSIVPSPDDPPLALELDLASGTGLTYGPGSVIEAEVTMTTRRSRSVIGNVPTVGALIVLTREGVVVGRGQWDPEDVDVVDLGPDDTLTVPGSGQVLLCGLPGADAPTVDLPSGAYQAYAVLDVMLKEVTESGGEARSVTQTVTVRSQPVDVVVDTPAG